ncbi:MAG: hypothetical protein KatS3mg035_2210 [Bacteroidia bacterium]|nr:MAG: hypothetical protein KatS3mg035_2210 [Bacteroidia bacterium]
MNKNRVFIIFLILSLNPTYSQKKHIKIDNCDRHVHFIYNKETNKESIKGKRKKICYISLDEGFNDSIEIYIDNKLIEKGFFKTNESLGTTEAHIPFKRRKCSIIRIISLTRGRCVEFMWDNRFFIARLFLENDSWVIIYESNFIIYE